MYVPIFPQLHLMPISCQFCNYSDSIVYHHVSDESTRMDSISASRIVWNPIWLSIPYHMPMSIYPSGTVCWFEEYHDPNCPPNHPMLIAYSKSMHPPSSMHTPTKHVANLWIHSPKSEYTGINWESINPHHDSYLLYNGWCQCQSASKISDHSKVSIYVPLTTCPIHPIP